MGYSKKELKMFIKYLKRVLKFISKIYKWNWNPLPQPLKLKNDLEKQLQYYVGKLNELKKDKSE